MVEEPQWRGGVRLFVWLAVAYFGTDSRNVAHRPSSEMVHMLDRSIQLETRIRRLQFTYNTFCECRRIQTLSIIFQKKLTKEKKKEQK